MEMFGINDSNQNNNTQAEGDAPAEAGTALPPSPFMANEPSTASEPSTPSSAPSLPAEQSAPVPAGDAPAAPQNEDAMVSLKAQALNSLAPLVNHLEQTPEEKFKTTMMLIQASDNSSLVKDAYEAANQISDEKARAQALLDVVNEINYFTQKDKENS